MNSRFLHSWHQLSSLARGQNPSLGRSLLGGVMLALAVVLILPIAFFLLLLQFGLMLIGAVVMLVRGQKPKPVVFYQNGYRREKVINPEVGSEDPSR
ncbi:hypothetical protein [Ferrimonas balearica]|uniref:hypothetical protein n=1 Tax=Ferrimonas balearica TaxID=44012 RepID=UPI001F270C97|nr:hypothetical protein [Ferrimonas balearica]MBY6019152.1 hypothetical protein [Halomonas denitrificans]MBY6095755.1 hypothetical protein [Ferrimonas balearica]